MLMQGKVYVGSDKSYTFVMSNRDKEIIPILTYIIQALAVLAIFLACSGQWYRAIRYKEV